MGHDPKLREMESARLDSWKEIASFLHRDARTVRRWERERHLPVHRVPGGERSGVFAYVSELESWLHSTGPRAGVTPADGRHGDIASKDDSTETSAFVDATESTATPQEASAASGGSAFQSVNSFKTTFQGESDFETGLERNAGQTDFEITPRTSSEDWGEVPSTQLPISNAAIYGGETSWRLRRYQIGSLVVLLSIAIGISAAVGHYRETAPGKTAIHRPSPEAQELYLRGRYYWNLRTEEGLNCAVDLFTQSIVHDPNYAEAYAGLADAYLLMRQYGHMTDAEAYPRALAAASRAIALNDASPEAHRSMAFILRFWNWDMGAAEKEYRRAIELNPKDSQSHHWYATALMSAGRNHEALAQIDIARQLEPQSVSVLADRGLILSTMDAHAGAVALQQVAEAQPSFPSTHIYLARAYLQLEDYDHFLAESRMAAELGRNAAMVALLDRARATLSERGAKPMLRELAAHFAILADHGAVSAYDAARLFGLAGQNENAMRYLHLACDHREPGFLSVEVEPAFTALRSSPEFSTLIDRRDTTFGGRQPIARLDTPQLSK